jgi:hypothetical protein
MVEYLMDVKKMTYVQVLEEARPPAQAYQETAAWNR